MMTKTKETAKKAMDRPMRVVGKEYASVSALVRTRPRPKSPMSLTSIRLIAD